MPSTPTDKPEVKKPNTKKANVPESPADKDDKKFSIKSRVGASIGAALESFGKTRQEQIDRLRSREHPIASLKRGGTAKKTGSYKLHKGEKVVGKKIGSKLSGGRKRVSPAKRAKNLRISEKIEVLRKEGKTGEQAAGMAYGMERAGRLRRGGIYVPVKK